MSARHMSAQIAAQTARTADTDAAIAVKTAVKLGTQGGFMRQLKEHQDFIVQACNAHDDLVAALKALVEPPLRYNGDRIEIDCDSHATAKKLVATARAVLVKVGAL